MNLCPNHLAWGQSQVSNQAPCPICESETAWQERKHYWDECIELRVKLYRLEIQAESHRKALEEIAKYDSGNGCCTYGCDTPTVAKEALKCTSLNAGGIRCIREPNHCGAHMAHGFPGCEDLKWSDEALGSR